MSQMVDLKRRWLKKKNDAFIEHLHKRSANTTYDDIKSLKRDYGPVIPVFIYDSFMKGCEDDVHFEDMLYFGPATTYDDQFILLQNPYHSIILPPTNLVMNHFNLHKGNIRRVQGELYGVPLEHVFWLDKVYDNGNTFNCDTLPIMLHQQTENAGMLLNDVLCYFGEIKTWTKPVQASMTVQVSPNVIHSEFFDTRVYRAYKESPVKIPKTQPDQWDQLSEKDWYQMGFDGYGGM